MAIDARVWEILARQTKHGVCDTMALPFCIKKYLKAKEEL
jgi:hypothetical protein